LALPSAGLIQLKVYKDIHMPRLLKRLQELSSQKKIGGWVSSDVKAEDVMTLLSLCAWERATKALPESSVPYSTLVSWLKAAKECPFMTEWLWSGHDVGWCSAFQGLDRKEERELWETYSYA
jgi:hypothetical protein